MLYFFSCSLFWVSWDIFWLKMFIFRHQPEKKLADVGIYGPIMKTVPQCIAYCAMYPYVRLSVRPTLFLEWISLGGFFFGSGQNKISFKRIWVQLLATRRPELMTTTTKLSTNRRRYSASTFFACRLVVFSKFRLEKRNNYCFRH